MRRVDCAKVVQKQCTIKLEKRFDTVCKRYVFISTAVAFTKTNCDRASKNLLIYKKSTCIKNKKVNYTANTAKQPM